MKRTHWLLDCISPNESDTDGEQFIACGLDEAEHLSRRKDEVTCKACLKFSFKTDTKAKETENEKLKEAVEAGYKLSTYAASIHWSDTEVNKSEWLTGLKEKIVLMQGLYNELNKD